MTATDKRKMKKNCMILSMLLALSPNREYQSSYVKQYTRLSSQNAQMNSNFGLTNE